MLPVTCLLVGETEVFLCARFSLLAVCGLFFCDALADYPYPELVTLDGMVSLLLGLRCPVVSGLFRDVFLFTGDLGPMAALVEAGSLFTMLS